MHVQIVHSKVHSNVKEAPRYVKAAFFHGLLARDKEWIVSFFFVHGQIYRFFLHSDFLFLFYWLNIMQKALHAILFWFCLFPTINTIETLQQRPHTV